MNHTKHTAVAQGVKRGGGARGTEKMTGKKEQGSCRSDEEREWPTTTVILENILQHLDMARHLLPLPRHHRIRLNSQGQAGAIGKPQVFAQQHVSPILHLADDKLFASNVRDDQERYEVEWSVATSTS